MVSVLRVDGPLKSRHPSLIAVPLSKVTQPHQWWWNQSFGCNAVRNRRAGEAHPNRGCWGDRGNAKGRSRLRYAVNLQPSTKAACAAIGLFVTNPQKNFAICAIHMERSFIAITSFPSTYGEPTTGFRLKSLLNSSLAALRHFCHGMLPSGSLLPFAFRTSLDLSYYAHTQQRLATSHLRTILAEAASQNVVLQLWDNNALVLGNTHDPCGQGHCGPTGISPLVYILDVNPLRE